MYGNDQKHIETRERRKNDETTDTDIGHAFSVGLRGRPEDASGPGYYLGSRRTGKGDEGG
jgi:hypothetical protein